MCALYSFLRITDDIGDGPQDREEREQALVDWRRRWRAALGGQYTHRMHAALHDCVSRFHIPPDYLLAVQEGVRMDLEPVRFQTFEQLYAYCYRVASAVGLACIHIWGFKEPAALEYAEKAGIGFQLTNILRDLAEDARRGRVYLPREDLDRFNYSEDRLMRGERDDSFRRLMSFQVQRARDYYQAAAPLADCLSGSGSAVFRVMARTYRGLLMTIERSDYDVFSRRITLPRWRKWWLAAQAMPARLGWI
jgi:phytoene synthase